MLAKYTHIIIQIKRLDYLQNRDSIMVAERVWHIAATENKLQVAPMTNYTDVCWGHSWKSDEC